MNWNFNSASITVPTPVVTLVMKPVREGFIDFVKIGVLLQTYPATAVVAPLVVPVAG